MIVLDANILIRAVLGQRVGQLLDHYSQQGIRFYAPARSGADADSGHIPRRIKRPIG